ncbi:uncharacterized protein LOC110887943 [Helianthus annuus]|uniref:uncharacterized protein LOC110887943 n=1 Tax=Helianthus annuus TaxID=4232 RepID=UPI000B8FFBAB|nr:uncharacterized protein LOC110887943 [Helianthus annuus]
MLIDDQVKDLPKDPADELDLHHMKSETLSRLNQYKGLKKDEPEPRVKRMICKIENLNYVAPENDAWRHDNKPAKKKPTPTLVDEPVIDPTELMQQGVDLMKETLDDFIKRNEEAKAAKVLHKIQVLKSDTEPEIDTSKIGVGKITLKVKPQKKKKGSDEEDETYIPTAKEKKKQRKKRNAVQTGVIPRNVRARERSATVPEMQSGKTQEVQVQRTLEVQAESIPEVEVQSVEKPEAETKKAHESPIFEKVVKNVEARKGDDDDEVVFTGERISTPPPPENPTIHIPDDQEMSKPKKVTSPGLFEGFPNVQGEFTNEILTGGEYDMFHDAKIKELTKKVSFLEKEKAKVEAKRDELKQKLEKSLEMNEEMKAVVSDHAKRIYELTEDLANNAKLIDQLTNELSEVNARYKNMNETNQTLHQMLDNLHEASSNENKVLKLEISAEYTICYEIQRVEERRAQREKELAEAATQKKKDLIAETQEAGGSSSQPER